MNKVTTFKCLITSGVSFDVNISPLPYCRGVEHIVFSDSLAIGLGLLQGTNLHRPSCAAESFALNRPMHFKVISCTEFGFAVALVDSHSKIRKLKSDQ